MSSTVSLPAIASDGSVPKAATSRLPIRPFKVLLAATMVTAGFFGISYESTFISSSDAVVTAYVLDVRTPIEGKVTKLPTAAGTSVQEDQLLAEVDNPLNDRQHLDSLLAAESAALATTNALGTEHGALVTERNQLRSRSRMYFGAITTRLDQQTVEADRTLAALKASLQEAKVELGRGRSLHSDGILSNSDYDKQVSTERVLEEEVSAQEAALASTRTQAAAARHGILSEPGTNNDVAYSGQRVDELTIRLAENARLWMTSRAQSEEASTEAAAEEMRSHQLTQTELHAPITGLLWQLNAVNGEQVTAGDTVLSLIDCNKQFLLAEIAQDRLPDVKVGGSASIRLNGESLERTGTVISVSGDPQRAAQRKLAAFPVQDPSKDLAIVLIRVNSASDGGVPMPCAIGRTARVRIPTIPSNLAGRWTRRVF